MTRRILYVQFTDPASYPPIEHASRLLADRGWDVLMLGTGSFAHQNFQFAPHRRIRLKKIGFVRGGFWQKLLYAYFFLWTLLWTVRWKPSWIYASDPLACPVAWLIQKIVGAHVVYHEHDSPDDINRTSSWFMKMVFACRGRLGRDAMICVLPQEERLLQFIRKTKRTQPSFCVWNCPRLDEIPDVVAHEKCNLVIYYHGSITPPRLPPSLIIAASRFRGAVRLQIAGFEVVGAIGYLQELIELAKTCGAMELIDSLGTMPTRAALFNTASMADIGLSLMPKMAGDLNLKHMVGASNKAFDYMACGLPLLVTESPDWISTFVDPGYGRACDPDNVDSIEATLRWYLENVTERLDMGRRCQTKIRQSWNYESTFADVLSEIERG
jgi:glycosyltransferase involved in cell wall biosynthesis